MLVRGHLHLARQLLRCPWSLRSHSLRARLMGASAVKHARVACRTAITGHVHERGFRRRPRNVPSTLQSTEHLEDEVDLPWGVNRDMQEDYRPPLEKEFEACKGSAAGMLGFRPHSRAELAVKLTDKGYDRETIERALARLQELGLQSDREFAMLYARSKWRQSRWAPSRIRIELVRKGVAKADIEGSLCDVFGDEEQQRHIMGQHHHHTEEGANEDAAEDAQNFDRQLLAAAQRQAALTKGMPSETRRRRLVSWLQRRGHGWVTVSAVLRELAL